MHVCKDEIMDVSEVSADLQSSSTIVIVVVLLSPGMTPSKSPGVVMSSIIVSSPSPTISGSMSSGKGCLSSVPENVTITLKGLGTEKSSVIHVETQVQCVNTTDITSLRIYTMGGTANPTRI